MAPEQIRGERCTAATDVFSAGSVFFQLASGQHTFSRRDRSLVQVVSAIVFEAQPSLSALCPDAPEGLEFILNKALEKDAAKRIQNAGDLKQAMSLCRITMKLGMPSTAPVAGDTRIMASPKVPAGGLPEPPTDPKSEAAPPTPVDEMKTKVMRRPVAPGPAMTPSPRPPAPPPVPQ